MRRLGAPQASVVDSTRDWEWAWHRSLQSGAGALPQLNVLILEDDLPTCNALRKLLRHEGFDVRCGHSSVDGLVLIAQQWPDVVLLDLMLADGDATPLIDVIRAQGKPTKIAVLSGSVDLAEASPERLRRVDQVFAKPVVADRLLAWFAAARTDDRA
jgi:DNA-binding response OmpR family regulator